MALGRFISFEGSEGCGKSTQIKRLCERLQGIGHEVLLTREPGGTELGECIRDLLQHAPEGENMTSESELLLFAASRAQLVRKVIKPKINAGAYVLADRFHDSTTIYQGIARGLGEEIVSVMNDFAVGDCLPDCTFLLDISVVEGRERIRARSGGQEDRMEREPDSFFEKVRVGYLELANNNPERFVLLDASKSADELELEIWDNLNKKYGVGS
ncbi:dTMP kinase [Verrucomicrobiales bacterium]|nr:dTMP kinase [Verrucomicrobiales bacterium]MDB4783035.1 dTMP kinase [Verrucomicrobiales bacterium]NCG27003.1 dTMP kinase [Verrucomicrobiales bacterium]|tara:strand:+ start:775 stop:1416 length:642 start_codon:yes stop_codon:yes gene_type:complete